MENNLPELNNLQNDNSLFIELLKNNNYDEIIQRGLKPSIDESESSIELIELLFSDEDYTYYLNRDGYVFDNETKNKISNIILNKYLDDENIARNFTMGYFISQQELTELIKQNRDIFEQYISKYGKACQYRFFDNDEFIKIILENSRGDLIQHIDNYSIDNLKLLVAKIDEGIEINYYEGNDRLLFKLFENKELFTSYEFCKLLDLFLDESCYKRVRNDVNNVDTFIGENLEFLLNSVSESGVVPKILRTSNIFREYCVKNNRIDIASKCIMSKNVFENKELLSTYSKELGITEEELSQRGKWLENYHNKNINIYNTVLASSLNKELLGLNIVHFERIINDVEFQMKISNLNDKELKIFVKIINNYDYKDYDISQMISSIIKNLKDYKELVNSLDIENITTDDIKQLVGVLQLSKNPFGINDISLLKNYYQKKTETFKNEFGKSNITESKDMLFKVLFNIDLNEAEYIDYKYNHNNQNEEMLESLKDSNLPKEIYDYLVIINKIIKTKDKQELLNIYNQFSINGIYNKEIPLETFLKSVYTRLYSDTLYKVDERYETFGPKEGIEKDIPYGDKNIKMYIPRENFRMLVHCIGYCSLDSEITDSNYRKDWMDRPLLQDHFVACSYISEKGLHSIISSEKVILGFDHLEGASILGMGNCDIDSIGRYANAYDGPRTMQEGNLSRARFYTPDDMLKTINERYNEIVIERKESNNGEYPIKRKPDYIVMMAESLEQTNFSSLEYIYKTYLPFISSEDIKEISYLKGDRNIKRFLSKYKEYISQIAIQNNIDLDTLLNKYTKMIMNSKYYENCLKASSEFDVPLVVIDKKYYFDRILYQSGIYTLEQINLITDAYNKGNDVFRKKIFNCLAKKEDVMSLINPKPQEQRNFVIQV